MSKKTKNSTGPSQIETSDTVYNGDTGATDGIDEKDAEKKSIYQIVASNRTYQIGIGAIVVLLALVLALGLYSSSVNTALDKTNAEKEQLEAAVTRHQQKLQQISAMLSSEQAESTQMKTMLQNTQMALEGEISKLASKLKTTKSKVGSLKKEKRAALKEKRKVMNELAQFKRFSGKFKRMIDAGKLEVVFRRGRMVVNLPAQVLFDSGSAKLSDDGMNALKEVAKVLRTVKNRRFIIGGHTDNKKIRKANHYETNWELASARATVVTRELIKSGMPARHLIAAGYSQYAPIASNATESGRQKNRRIEIILEPYLKDITPPKKKSKSSKTAALKKKSERRPKS